VIALFEEPISSPGKGGSRSGRNPDHHASGQSCRSPSRRQFQDTNCSPASTSNPGTGTSDCRPDSGIFPTSVFSLFAVFPSHAVIYYNGEIVTSGWAPGSEWTWFNSGVI
jgi:hypothetical protein